MNCRLVGLDHYRGSLPGLAELWRRGEVRDLPDEAAAYMVATFPGAVEVIDLPTPAKAPTMDHPPVDRMIRSGGRALGRVKGTPSAPASGGQ